MLKRLLTAAAVAALAMTPIAASASSPGTDGPDRGAAIKGCIDFNESGPVRLVDVVNDGLGDYLVWVEDKAGHLWACNASGYGDVYANVRIDGDLLDAKGVDLIHEVSDTGWMSPALNAERVCMSMANGDTAKAIATAADGAGGYLVWIENATGDLTMCNASGKGEVFAFLGVDMPLNPPPGGAVS
jgi:hypothetical protein